MTAGRRDGLKEGSRERQRWEREEREREILMRRENEEQLEWKNKV
jgi:hypothetical protein